MKKIENHIEAIAGSICRIDTTLALQAEQLKSHIKRTELLEARVQPIEEVVIAMKGILKFLAFVCTVIAIAEAIPHVMKVVALWLH